MKHTRLTSPRRAAKPFTMQETQPEWRDVAKRPLAAGILMAATTALTGCINVTAPSEPIVIELNINIRQEVIYRLAEDAGNTIEENADIF